MTEYNIPICLTLKVVIHERSDGGYWVEVPGFPGCASEGDSLSAAQWNAKEAFQGVLETMQNQEKSK